MKRMLVNLVLLAGTLLVLFLALEGVSRLVMERPQKVAVTGSEESRPAASDSGAYATGLYKWTPTGRRLNPGVTGVIQNHYISGHDVEIKTDSLGFRYPGLGEKSPGDLRILALGDSITMGDYLQADETYPHFTEEALKKMGVSGGRVEVINAGVSGIDIEAELAILMESGLKAKPDVVLLGLYLNDAQPSLSVEVTKLPDYLSWSYFLGFVANRFDFLKKRFTYERMESERGFNAVLAERDKFLASNPVSDGDWHTDRGGFNMLIYTSFRDWGYAWSDEAWKRIEKYASLMKELSEDNGFRLAVVLFPSRYQVQSEMLRDEPQKDFRQMVARLGIDGLDLLPLLRKKYKEDGVNVYYDHCHYTPDGNRFIGVAVAGFLKKEVLAK